MFGSSAPATSNVPAGVIEGTPDDIPKEELMQLCMKMNKRMQAMETKGKELVKKKTSLLNDRQKLLALIQSCINLTISTSDDQELDIQTIELNWQKWDSNCRSNIIELEQKLKVAEQSFANSLSELELKHKKELMDLRDSGSTTQASVISSVLPRSSSEMDDWAAERKVSTYLPICYS